MGYSSGASKIFIVVASYNKIKHAIRIEVLKSVLRLDFRLLRNND